MRRIFLKAAACASSLFVGGVAQASNWVRVAQASTGTIWEVDLDRVGQRGTLTEAWVRLDHRNDPTVAARTTMMLIRFNCRDWTASTISSVRYRANGTTYPDPDLPAYGAPYRPIVPETVLEGAANVVCGRSPSPSTQSSIRQPPAPAVRQVSGAADIQDCFDDLDGELVAALDIRAYCTCTVNRMVQLRENEQTAMGTCATNMGITLRPSPQEGRLSVEHPAAVASL